MTQKIKSEVVQVYDTWLESYMSGDVATYDSYLDDAYHFRHRTGSGFDQLELALDVVRMLPCHFWPLRHHTVAVGAMTGGADRGFGLTYGGVTLCGSLHAVDQQQAGSKPKE